MPIINFDNVSYSYPEIEYTQNRQNHLALDGINLSVNEGEILAVMGENGSGKSTLCKLINGIIPHSCGGNLTGTVIVDGICTKESSVPALSFLTGLVLDDPDAQLFTSSVRNEAAFGPENLLVPPHEIEERVKHALNAVGLAGFETRLPSSLSGGEKQRLAIASFLTMKSRILVLDEPLCRLDPEGEALVMSVLKNLKEVSGMTVIITSHNARLMLKYADRVCILNKGKIIALDTADKILNDCKLLEENGIQPPEQYEIESYFVPADTVSVLQDNTIIELNNFSYSYNSENPLLKNINLKITENEFTAVIGHNGCGKTSLLKCIAGLLRSPCKNKDNGDIFLKGRSIKEMQVSEISKEIGFVMQNPDNQLFSDSVYNETVFALKNFNLSKEEISIRAIDALNTVGLNDHDAFPHALSRTDRTKLVIACVLAMGCRIIFFDEADVGSDYRDCVKIMDIAEKLHTKGYTIVFVTHNMQLVCKYAEKLIKIEKEGTITEWKQIKN